AQSYTPSVQTFDWTLSPVHKVYSICEDIVAANPHTYESFSWATPPHPNCLSYVKYNEKSTREFTSDLKRWANNPTASGTDYLNEWQQTYYEPTQNGDKTNFFNLILAKTDSQKTLSLRRAA
ncbi:unnamed protein product, partial [marine sediment metagenome]